MGWCGEARREGVAMPERSKRAMADGELRRVTLLESLAAAVILTMVLLVLFMIFVYKPA